jgi:hypothetical protein
MNIWDSVHRSLEKASQEAGRIARIQRLRSTADALSRQIQIQHAKIVERAMDLFVLGRLTQPELVSLCQEFASLQQQLAQVQQELKQVQSFSGPANAPGATPPINVEETMPAPAPPPPPTVYPLPVDSTTPIPPPPPTGEPHTVSGVETLLPTMPAPITREIALCRVCQAELLPGHAFCHQCGTAISSPETSLPTLRSSPVTQGPTIALPQDAGPEPRVLPPAPAPPSQEGGT